MLLVLPVFLANLALAQQSHPYGGLDEAHPIIRTHKCTKTECKAALGGIVVEQNQRPILAMSDPTGATKCTGYKNGTVDNLLDPKFCPDAETCAKNCGLAGIDYADHGVTTTQDAVTLHMITKPKHDRLGDYDHPRVYLLKDKNEYEAFHLKNQEFTFDVDISKMPCGSNGALYFIAMNPDGGKNYTGNGAGPAKGTGYCDAQCTRDPYFINGKANLYNYGTNKRISGACCAEMDIWEANKQINAMTPHVCNGTVFHECKDPVECGDAGGTDYGFCDKAGCDLNTFRNGAQSFYGPSTLSAKESSGHTHGMMHKRAYNPKAKVDHSGPVTETAVDTNLPFTVVTQFITKDNTAKGDLVEIKRFYVQHGVVINSSMTSITGVEPTSSITDKYCEAKTKVFGEQDGQTHRGALKGMGEAFDGPGMVLSMSIWDSTGDNMNWLDSYLGNKTAKDIGPGEQHGPCRIDEGNATMIESQFPDMAIVFGNLRWGDIGSTFGPTAAKGALEGGLPGTSEPAPKNLPARSVVTPPMHAPGMAIRANSPKTGGVGDVDIGKAVVICAVLGVVAAFVVL